MSGDTFTNILVQNQLLVTGSTVTTGITDSGTIAATNLTVANPTQNYASVVSFAGSAQNVGSAASPANALYSATPTTPTKGVSFISTNASTGVFSNTTGKTITVLVIINHSYSTASENATRRISTITLASGPQYTIAVCPTISHETVAALAQVVIWSSSDTLVTKVYQDSGTTVTVTPSVQFVLL